MPQKWSLFQFKPKPHYWNTARAHNLWGQGYFRATGSNRAAMGRGDRGVWWALHLALLEIRGQRPGCLSSEAR